jgi:phospholipid-transporting ATPase
VSSSNPTPSPRQSTISPLSFHSFCSSSSDGEFSTFQHCCSSILTPDRYANIFFLIIGLLQQIPGVSPTGKYVTIVPLFFILALIAIKEIIEDVKRHQADRQVNGTKVKVLSGQSRAWEARRWREVRVGDILRIEDSQYFPADLVLLSSSEPQGMCYIETANLDGETNLKIRSSLKATSGLTEAAQLCQQYGQAETEPPNRQLYEFAGNLKLAGDTDLLAVSANQLLLRGARLRNTGWVAGLVVYTGHETKLLMNSTKAPLKRSTIDVVTNHQILFLFFILVLLSLVSALGNWIQSNGGEDHERYNPPDLENEYFGFGWQFITFFILYNNLIPISLQVTLELIKFVQALYINWDEAMHHIDPELGIDSYALARTSNLNEELGQIKYVFSDKTGTLTRNVMEYKRCSVAGQVYGCLESDEGPTAGSGHADLVANLLQVTAGSGSQGVRVSGCQGARVPGCEGARVSGCQGAGRVRQSGCRPHSWQSADWAVGHWVTAPARHPAPRADIIDIQYSTADSNHAGPRGQRRDGELPHVADSLPHRHTRGEAEQCSLTGLARRTRTGAQGTTLPALTRR